MRVTSSWLTEGAGSVHQRPAPPAAGIHATTPNNAATGCKETTIRWHLRQIFAKRGIARQAELVRLVLSLGGAAHGRR